MKNAIEYEYPKDARVIISQLNSKNQVIQRRMIPKKRVQISEGLGNGCGQAISARCSSSLR